jgi:CheY-like chemotaxis protein
MARVLIVDDEPDVLLMLRIALESAGHETGLAADGDEALQRLRRDRFDVVVLDIMMPVLDGWGVLAALADDPDAPPVVVITADHGASEQRARDLGATGFLLKPLDMDVLLSRVNAVTSAA